MSEVQPLYSVGTWDTERQGFTRDDRLTCPSINVTQWQLLECIRQLRHWGYAAWRYRNPDGSHESGDPYTIIERTDGMHYRSIAKRWRRRK